MCFLMCWDCIYIFGVNLNENENSDKIITRENAVIKWIMKDLKENVGDVFLPHNSRSTTSYRCDIWSGSLQFPVLIFSKENICSCL